MMASILQDDLKILNMNVLNNRISKQVEVKTDRTQNHNQIYTTPSGIYHQKRETMVNVGEDGKKLEPSLVAGGNAKWCRHFGKQFDSSSKT